MNGSYENLNDQIKLVYQDGQDYFVHYRSGKGKIITEKELNELKKQFKFTVGKSKVVEPSKDEIVWHA